MIFQSLAQLPLEIIQQKLSYVSHPLLVHMVKQMVLTVFIVPITLGAEPELQIRAVQLRPAANRTFVLGDTWPLAGLLTVDLLSMSLLGRYGAVIPGTQEEHQHVQKRT